MGKLMTVSERKADAAAKSLVRALRNIEKFQDDPEMIFDSAEVQSNRDSLGVKDALAELREHYCESGPTF